MKATDEFFEEHPEFFSDVLGCGHPNGHLVTFRASFES